MAAIGLRLVSATAATASLAAGSALYSDDGLRRSARFWSGAVPIYIHYRLLQFRTDHGILPPGDPDAAYESLHDRYAPQVEALALKLRGLYLKSAQLLSSLDDAMPDQYLAWCKKLQDAAPVPFAPGMARRVVAEAIAGKTGRKFEDVFAEWDDEPAGSASIGVVHRAVLNNPDKTVVAVKVQQPGVEQMFRSDLKTVLRFCEVAMTQHVAPLKEIEKQFMTEFDYEGEARNLASVRDNVMPVFGDRVFIPAPFPGLCTREVLVMEWADGVRLVDGVRNMYRKLATRAGYHSLEELEREQRKKLDDGVLHWKTLEQERRDAARLQQLLRVKDNAENLGRFVYNWSWGWVCRRTRPYQWSEEPINLGEVLALLLRVHGHEILVDGCFNGDPHPGNVLLMPDGRLGLVDYGQVKKWDKEQRRTYARLIVALAEDNRQEIVRVLRDEVGVVTRRSDPEVLYKLACFWNDRDTDDITGGQHMQRFLDWAESEDAMVETGGDFVMASRVSILMRGMGKAFGLQLRVAKAWESLAREVLQGSPTPESR